MLTVKMMASSDLLSDDSRAPFSLHSEIRSVIFERPADADRPIITIVDKDYVSVGYGVFGPVYVMNEAGKTISMFSPDDS